MSTPREHFERLRNGVQGEIAVMKAEGHLEECFELAEAISGIEYWAVHGLLQVIEKLEAEHGT